MQASSIDDAIRVCKEKGMELISIDSAFEETMVSKQFQRNGTAFFKLVQINNTIFDI